jgi:NAD-dependent dihydropyrimidine dehydrogenase PreA subunit
MSGIFVSVERALVDPVSIDLELCSGCGQCIEACPSDLFLPDPNTSQPVVMYPGECWYEGVCVEACPSDAITLHRPASSRVHWRPKSELGSPSCS